MFAIFRDLQSRYDTSCTLLRYDAVVFEWHIGSYKACILANTHFLSIHLFGYVYVDEK